jgi:proline racemase
MIEPRNIRHRGPTLRTLDVHTAGEPLRIVTGGLPPIPGNTILEKRRYCRENLDHVRTALMWEPRGHADMYGCILTEPVTPDGTLGVLFLHNDGYSTMCGHAVIGLVTAAVETGFLEGFEVAGEVKLDTPAGRVTAVAHRDGDRVTSVSFLNVPSWVEEAGEGVDVPGVGEVPYDLVFGGAYYAVCRAEDLGVRLVPGEASRIIELGRRMKKAVAARRPIRHPENEDLGFLYGTIFVSDAHDPGHHSRNACVFADGELDRSPTGTGVSGRAALHVHRGELGVGEPFVVESILGTTFTGRVVEETRVGDFPAVLPQVTGSAHVVGWSEWLLDPEDPLRHGFLLR